MYLVKMGEMLDKRKRTCIFLNKDGSETSLLSEADIWDKEIPNQKLSKINKDIANKISKNNKIPFNLKSKKFFESI